MDNPFQIITDAFAPDYQINLSIQGLDGSIMLTLSNGGRIVAKRMISAEQRNDASSDDPRLQHDQLAVHMVEFLDLVTRETRLVGGVDDLIRPRHGRAPSRGKAPRLPGARARRRDRASSRECARAIAARGRASAAAR